MMRGFESPGVTISEASRAAALLTFVQASAKRGQQMPRIIG
jgi:hypothetical protein